MIVVSDTGPLNYLALLGHAEVLSRLFDRVVIPHAVATELSQPRCPEAVRNLIASPPPWLRVERVSACDTDLSALGRGEQEAIALAYSLRADLLLCDDKAARDAAMRKGIRVIGTLGVLQRAAEEGLVDLRDAMGRLRRTNFRIARPLLQQILDAAERPEP